MIMSAFLSLCLAAAPLPASAPAPAPLAVTQVIREGLPPYEDDQRLYRLEGEGSEQLKPGRTVLLYRRREPRRLPRLEIVEVHPRYALARITAPTELFPLRGDLAFAVESLATPPALPALGPVEAGPGLGALTPSGTLQGAPGPEPGFTPQREPLFFLKGETRLSPAGHAKLTAWVKAWGKGRRWSIACPPWPGESLDLTAARIAVVREELHRLGVLHAEEVILTEEPQGDHPLIYVAADPW